MSTPSERRSTLLAGLVALGAAAAACAVAAWAGGGPQSLPDGALTTRMGLLPRAPLAGVAALVLVQFLFARRHFGDHAGALAALLTACSPLVLAVGRLPSPDALAAAAQTAALWLFLDLVRERENRLAPPLFVGLFALALALKERSVVFALPMLAFALHERFARRSEVSLARVAAALATPLFAGFVLWTVGDGSFATAVRGVASDYTALHGRGTWDRPIVELLLLSPWTTALALGALGWAVWRWRHGEYEALDAYVVLVVALALALLAGGGKSVRDVVALDALLRMLLVAYAAREVSRRRTAAPDGATRAPLAAALAVLALCTSDSVGFRTLFVARRVVDPTASALLEARDFVPPAPR